MTAEARIVDRPDQRPVTVRTALREGAEFLSRLGVPGARLDAEVLLCRVLGCGRGKLFVAFESILGAEAMKQFHSLLRRRAQREPISYITGHREFWSLDFDVTPQVLVPRPETELLVEVALDILGKRRSSSRILEIGTGSGAIAVTLATQRVEVEIWATDLSAGALEVARHNARRHAVEERIHFLQGDLFDPVRHWGEGFFHLIVSNPPYVPRRELEVLSAEVRNWEPRLALDGGEDGLDFYRRIFFAGDVFLAGGGYVAFEIGADRGAEVLPVLEQQGGYLPGTVYYDYAGRERVVAARKLR